MSAAIGWAAMLFAAPFLNHGRSSENRFHARCAPDGRHERTA